MGEDLYYSMERRRVGTAVIINNLDLEQPPTKNDVENMGAVLKNIGFDVEVHVNLTSQGMNSVKRKVTEESKHKDANCFLMLIISHGTADNFLVDKDGNKTWNIESLVTEVCDVQSLIGKPKLFFIEACRGKENNFSTQMMTKSSAPPQQSGISLPSKQDVFVGFATVPGFVSFTNMRGSPYLQALSSILSAHHATTDLSDIHLLVKRKLAGMKLGADGARQGAEERSSLLSKLLFSRYSGNHCGKIEDDSGSLLSRFSSLSPFMPGKQNSPSSETQSVSIPIKITDSLPSDMNGMSRTSSLSTPTAEARSRYFSSLSSPSYTPTPLSVTTNKRPASLIFSSGVSKPPRSAMFTSPMSSSYSTSQSTSSNQDSPNSVDSFSSQKPPIMLQITPTPSIFTNQSTTNVHVVEIQSSDVEGGLKDLLNKVTEVYGGEGKVKMKKNKKKDNSYSFKYIGPEKAALLLEKALKSVKELQKKSSLWKFTQRLEISVI
eukprot:TRINITY_DN6877_c0_g1_i6.p1 TRINITY_DN6877_c0_g1~~TRINITY_DN6877_c0_g1_i6.p1  ORF type:complete len:550 (+),score=134.88 TRINITY_DN6877_c0_g1_i6:180-1652(+)